MELNLRSLTCFHIFKFIVFFKNNRSYEIKRAAATKKAIMRGGKRREAQPCTAVQYDLKTTVESDNNNNRLSLSTHRRETHAGIQ